MDSGVRLARTSDVDDIADVQVRSWRAAYAGVLPSEVLGSLDPGDLALEWGRALLASGTHRVLVAVDGPDVVGAASVGPAHDPRALGAGEIGLFVIDPRAWRRGHGSRLLAACVDVLRASGHGDAITWIPLADEPRRAFLASAGWGPDGAYRDLETAPGQVMREVRLITDIRE